MQNMQVQVMQRMTMTEQQQKADRDEFSTEMRKMRDANATLLQEKTRGS